MIHFQRHWQLAAVRRLILTLYIVIDRIVSHTYLYGTNFALPGFSQPLLALVGMKTNPQRPGSIWWTF